MSIIISNLNKSFKDVIALDNVSVTFEENKIYGLLGNNGAGKSTLLNLVANRIYKDEGKILIDEMSNEDNDMVLGNIFLMNDQNMYPDDMTVKKAITSTSLFYPDFDTKYSYELLKKFQINTKSKITTLSTGQLTMFKLAIALSTNIKYLLLDEPVLGLDASNRDLFYRILLDKYSEKPFCVIISSHLIQEIENLTEHTVIIKNGKIIVNQDNDSIKQECYSVSGPKGLVDDYTNGKSIIHETVIGGLKSVSIRGTMPYDSPVGLEISNINMQDYFIQLMNEEDKNNE